MLLVSRRRNGMFHPALCVLALFGLAPISRADLPDSPLPAAGNPTEALSVDTTGVAQKIIHVKLYVPAQPGPLTLVYPKWIPGEHGPTGPIDNVAGLTFTAAGRTLPWKRDLYDMYAFHLTVPPGANAVEVTLDFLLSSDLGGFSSSGLTTPNLVNVNWNQLLLYPQGRKADRVNVTASLRLPPGWKYGTALPVSREAADTVYFQTAPLVTLIDSPVVAGRYFKAVPLTESGETPAYEIDMVSDSPASLEMPAGQIQAYKNLVKEAGALFGARHYRDYHFLYTLSNHVASFGLEHHESSDDRTWERAVIDDPRKGSGNLLPHEFVHSWNGKYRRPYDLATPDYQQPMRTDLLWVYEGLTQYYGSVLTARCGLWNAQDFEDEIMGIAARLDHEPGRDWRSLADTADSAQLLYDSPGGWSDYRRGVDFYDEMVLVWLEADTIIRRQTGGRRSLDDFCRRFYGGGNTPPELKPYTFDDVVAGLNAMAPYDWRGFFNARVNAIEPHAPLGGIIGGGWKLVYSGTPERGARGYSTGISVGFDGQINGVTPGTPGALAGLGEGMKIVAVNGRAFSADVLREAVTTAKTSPDPIQLLVESGDFFKTISLDYHGGILYPHLERDTSQPDLIAQIVKPLVTPPAPADTTAPVGKTAPPGPPPGPSPASPPAQKPSAPTPVPPSQTEPQKTKP